MTYDFSHYYRKETIEVKDDEGVVIFTAVVRELTHGEKTDIQMHLATKVDMPLEGSKKARQRKYQQEMQSAVKNGGLAESTLLEEVSCIVSWTLLDAKGEKVPVCIEAWKQIPSSWAKQIEEAIERLNPEIDEEFQD